MPRPNTSNRYSPCGSHWMLAAVRPITMPGMTRTTNVVIGDVPPNSNALRKVAITEFSKRAANGQAQTIAMIHSNVSMIFATVATVSLAKSHSAASANPVAASTAHRAVAMGKFLLNADMYVRSRYPFPSLIDQAVS